MDRDAAPAPNDGHKASTLPATGLRPAATAGPARSSVVRRDVQTAVGRLLQAMREHRRIGSVPRAEACSRSERSAFRKEVIQPQVPLRLPCYDFTPVADPTVDACLRLRVSSAASGRANSHGVTGGVYKARERIHRGVLIHDY